MNWARIIYAAMSFAFVSACVSFPPAPEARVAPGISDNRVVVRDGAALGLDVWRADNAKAVIIAVHGMNDYAHAFAGAGEYWSREAGITLYAYDQRGFGRSPDFGQWPGEETLKADLIAVIAAVRADNPGLPVFVLGHSMGAAVVMTTAADAMLDVNGAILASPGVWGGGQLPITYRLAINIAASVTPGKTLTGERAQRQATDNIPVLRAMREDPHVIKATRLDAILGVVRIMGNGFDVSDEIGGNILFLYGEKDEIIPIKSMTRALNRLCGDIDKRVYPEGWHLLFRDLQAETVWRDVADWALANARGENAAGHNLRLGPAAVSCSGAGLEAQRARLYRGRSIRVGASR